MMAKKKIAIIGGGRWARNIAGVLNEFLTDDYIISIHSSNNFIGLKSWIEEKNYNRVKICSKWPHYDDLPDATIIANSAKYHFASAVASILYRIPTLVEKPLAMSYSEAEFLTKLSFLNGQNLYCAHVFLFAQYLNTYTEIVKNYSPFKQINIIWSDPTNEERYGEIKRYDSSVPIINDVIPHILSILRSFTNETIDIQDCKIDRGGAKVIVICRVGLTLCTIYIERNATKRCRLLDVKTSSGAFILDFTIEPGFIQYKKETEIIDMQCAWSSEARPLRKMLESFIRTVNVKGYRDTRLDPILGLEACYIADITFQKYRKELVKWLSASKKQQEKSAFEYAMDELFCDPVFVQNNLKEILRNLAD